MKIRDIIEAKFLEVIIDSGNTLTDEEWDVKYPSKDGKHSIQAEEVLADFILSKDTLELLRPLYELKNKEAKTLFLEHSRNQGDYIPDYKYNILINALSNTVGVRKEDVK